ncbi:MAG: hypothetical protein PHC86_09465, partial [Eubacteriales bacterium]|nr:hypothetical protein [Eubacteriales bacterium]
FLGLENLMLQLDFSAPPDEVTIDWLGETNELELEDDAIHYTWQTQVPLTPQTLSWQNERLEDSLNIQVHAQKETPTGKVSASASIRMIEITGDIFDIYPVLSG